MHGKKNKKQQKRMPAQNAKYCKTVYTKKGEKYCQKVQAKNAKYKELNVK